MELWPHQKKAVTKLSNGKILVGGTGSGKSLTGLAYYKTVVGADKHKQPPRPLYIITTAKKRDEGDWSREATKVSVSIQNVDSWNNLHKYEEIRDAFFIFDEQRLVGSGAWVKSFYKIARKNMWILLSATPADTWIDLIPVFVANGFYKNKTAFLREHVLYAPYLKYPKIIGYRNEEKLERLKTQLFVLMPIKRHTTSHVQRIKVYYNEVLVKEVLKTQWDPFENKPLTSLAAEIFLIRKIININYSRVLTLLEIYKVAKRMIIFYNFNYELEILKRWFTPITTVREHNGHKHDPVPEGEHWVYLVQYYSGSEAWECFTTNHMAFYSLTYSYRMNHQARGRINRNNTPYEDLYYYELVSDSFLDKAILRAFENKKSFNVKMLDLGENNSA